MENNPTGNLQKMAEFIANAEIAQHAVQKDAPDIKGLLKTKSHQVDQQLDNIKTDINHFRDLMTRAGAIAFRKEAQEMSESSKKEAQQLEKIYGQVKVDIATHCEQLNKASMSTVKNVSRLISSARKNHLHQLAEEKSVALQKACSSSLKKINHIVSSLQWKNLVIAILVTCVTATIVDLYIDNAWPWQVHQQIIKQREAGKVLLHSWTALSHNDQETIIQYA